MDAIFQAVFELLAYWTARLLLPVLSFGRVRVEPMMRQQQRNKPRWKSAPLTHPLPGGGIGVGPDFAVLIGLMLWVVIALLVAAGWLFVR